MHHTSPGRIRESSCHVRTGQTTALLSYREDLPRDVSLRNSCREGKTAPAFQRHTLMKTIAFPAIFQKPSVKEPFHQR